MTNGKLAPCPASPNCVSTQAERSNQFVEPIPLTVQPEIALARLTTLIRSCSRARIVTSASDYIHAEFKSLIFRFIDDVEFNLDTEGKQIHFRSASRIGHSDMGVNRRRMDKLRKAYDAIGAD